MYVCTSLQFTVCISVRAEGPEGHGSHRNTFWPPHTFTVLLCSYSYVHINTINGIVCTFINLNLSTRKCLQIYADLSTAKQLIIYISCTNPIPGFYINLDCFNSTYVCLS